MNSSEEKYLQFHASYNPHCLSLSLKLAHLG
uniref:Uncharacterized protein n=1 Tax=Rhizophora mucronata TaxID=61149 RepID=A0A2P2P7V0_RHIMU